MDELRQFLGQTGSIETLFQSMQISLSASPSSLKKGIKFEWTEQCESAFNTLIEELCTAPTLQYPDQNKPFKLFTDASTTVIQASYTKPGVRIQNN